MTTLKIGIATYDQMKARTIAIAKGEHKPKRGEPKVCSPQWRALPASFQIATATSWI